MGLTYQGLANERISSQSGEMMNVTTEKDQTNKNGQRWLILIVAPVLWMAYFLVVYLLDEASCGLGFWRNEVWGTVTVVGLFSLGVTVVILLLITYIGYRGLKLWQSSASNLAQSSAEKEMAERDRFIGLAVVMLSALFVLLTVGVGLTFLVLRPC